MDKGNLHSLEDDYYLKEVVPHFISDSVFSPGESLTPTNVGIALAKRVHPSDDSYGTHASKYSGIGYEKIDHPDFISTPRTIAHMRTGVHWDISESTSSPRHRQFLAAKNKAHFAQPIKELGNDIFKALKRDKHTMETHSSKKENILFPKSRVYDYEYIRDEYHKKLKAKKEALEKSEDSDKQIVKDMPKKTVPCTPGSLLKLECAEFEKNKTRPTSLPWWPDPPYWYDSKQADRNPIPSRNINDFTIPKMPESVEEHNWLEEMELTKTKNYIPGEIYKNKTPKQPVEDLSKTGSCNKEWKPRIEEASGKIFDVQNIQNEKTLEKEVDRRRIMEYSESLGLDKPKPKEIIPFKSPCKVRNRQKKTTTCACGTCQCVLDPKLVEKEEKTSEDQEDKIVTYEIPQAWDWPGRKPLYIGSWGKHRAEEFQKVGLPFRKDATIWQKKVIGRIYDPSLYKQSAKGSMSIWSSNKSSITKYSNLFTLTISGIKDIIFYPFEMCGNLVKLGYIPRELYVQRSELDRTIYEIPSRLGIVKKVLAEEGITGFTRGLYSTLMSNFIYESILLSFPKYYDGFVQGYLKDINIHGYITRLLKVCSTHAIAVILSQPFEVVAAIQVGQYVGKETIYSGFFIMPFIQLLIHKGITGYFSGVTPRLIRCLWLNIIVDVLSVTLGWFLVYIGQFSLHTQLLSHCLSRHFEEANTRNPVNDHKMKQTITENFSDVYQFCESDSGDQNVSYISNSQQENELHTNLVKYKKICIVLSKLTATVIVGKFVGPMEVLEKNYEIVNSGILVGKEPFTFPTNNESWISNIILTNSTPQLERKVNFISKAYITDGNLFVSY